MARPVGPAGAEDSPAPQVEHCDLCAEVIGEQHRHILDLEDASLQCACQACCVLFDRTAAGGRHYRLVPNRRTCLADLRLDGSLWAGLGVPVEMAFFVRDSRAGAVIARYPSVAGALRHEVPPDSWDRVVEANSSLAQLDADVEALTVNRAHGARDYWILPLDDCYRLTALLRMHWSGFTGGDRVWREITEFFAEMKESR